MMSARPGLHRSSQRRGVMPLVLFWNFSGSTWWKSLNLQEKEDVLERPAGTTSQSVFSKDSHTGLHDVRVDLSHSVDGVGPHHAQVSHVDPLRVSFLDQRHPPQTLHVSREHGRDQLWDTGSLGTGDALEPLQGALGPYVQVSPVDLVDDEQMARQQPLEHLDRPALQGLRQNRVVGVGAGPARDVPGLDGQRHS